MYTICNKKEKDNYSLFSYENSIQNMLVALYKLVAGYTKRSVNVKEKQTNQLVLTFFVWSANTLDTLFPISPRGTAALVVLAPPLLAMGPLPGILFSLPSLLLSMLAVF